MSGYRKFVFAFVATLVVLIGVTASPNSAAAAAPRPLTAAEADGYLLWLHSLEQSTAGRLKAELPESTPLYPFDQPIRIGADQQPYRHLAISRAVTELESRRHARGEGLVRSPLLALAHARNYTNLSEFDSAQVWFNAAAQLDSSGSFRREIGRESLAAAIASSDSTTIVRRVTNTLGTHDLRSREAEVVLALRWLIAERDTDALSLLLQKIDQQGIATDARVAYWRTFTLAWLGRRDEALIGVRDMVRSGSLSRGLSESQRAWVLTALPDLYLLLGERGTARSLYEKLGESALDHLRLWGRYQLAGMDFRDKNYAQASQGFNDVCDATGAGSWREHACAMAEITATLSRIRREGEHYGANAYRMP